MSKIFDRCLTQASLFCYTFKTPSGVFFLALYEKSRGRCPRPACAGSLLRPAGVGSVFLVFAVFIFAIVLLTSLAVGGIFLLVVSVHVKESPLSSEFVSIVWTENAGLMRKNQRARRFFPRTILWIREKYDIISCLISHGDCI